jgi:Protein of unknown function (DUF1573)
MSRNWSYFVLLLLTVAALAGVWCTSRWGAPQVANEPLQETAGRLQLVVDDQDVGLVRQGTQLDVHFAVANVGTEKLLLRQAPRECCSGETLPKFTVEPGQTGEIIARLQTDDLLARGRKNIRFFTSDVTNPEVWVTVRGTVIRHVSAPEDFGEID